MVLPQVTQGGADFFGGGHLFFRELQWRRITFIFSADGVNSIRVHAAQKSHRHKLFRKIKIQPTDKK